MPQHSLSFGRRRVAASGLHPDRIGTLASLFEFDFQSSQWTQQVALDVVVECTQRRDVEHLRLSAAPFACQQLVQGPQEGRQRLAAAGGSNNENVLPGRDARPDLCLHLGRLTDLALEPARHHRMKDAQRCLCLLGCHIRLRPHLSAGGAVV